MDGWLYVLSCPPDSMGMAWHGGMVGESVVGIHELEWTHGHGHSHGHGMA